MYQWLKTFFLLKSIQLYAKLSSKIPRFESEASSLLPGKPALR
jgi:hypothetical protein